MNNIIFLAYHFRESDGVGSMRSRAIAELLEKRKNNVIYITKDSFGKLALKYKIIWNVLLLIKLLSYNYKTLYVSCGPFDHLLLLPLVKKLKNIRIIVDFRDPWSLNIKTGYGNRDNRVNILKLKVSEIIEKKVYASCDYFWVSTKGMADEYSKLFLDNSKIVVVTNGFNFNYKKFKNDALKSNSNTLKFVCLGQFAEYSTSKAEKILAQLRDYKEKNDNSSIEIHFIGTNKKNNEYLIKKYNLENQVIFYPKLPYDEALTIASKCHIGLVISRNEDFDYGTKIYDYIGLGIPVFESFEKGKDFSNTFSLFFTKFKKKYIPDSLKGNYHRMSILKDHIGQIDLKN